MARGHTSFEKSSDGRCHEPLDGREIGIERHGRQTVTECVGAREGARDPVNSHETSLGSATDTADGLSGALPRMRG